MRQAGWLYRQACSVQGRERLWVKGRALGQKLQLSLGCFKGPSFEASTGMKTLLPQVALEIAIESNQVHQNEVDSKFIYLCPQREQAYLKVGAGPALQLCFPYISMLQTSLGI